MIEKPFSQACENNKHPIGVHLQRLLKQDGELLEIGSGTGQHAVHFAHLLPHIRWQTSDREAYHAGINLWIDEATRHTHVNIDNNVSNDIHNNFNNLNNLNNFNNASNLLRPVTLDVLQSGWPAGPVNAIFSANTAHIMSWQAVVAMFTGVGNLLKPDGLFMLYGPFNYDGAFSSESNARFDAHLKLHAPEQGIRDIEDINKLAEERGLTLQEDNAMPANNRLLVFKKTDVERKDQRD